LAADFSPVIETFKTVTDAWYAACKQAAENDRIIVFGSFLTVAAVMEARQRNGELVS
jgi:dihydrofolate synthase/folylpolyglutamate synthase